MGYFSDSNNLPDVVKKNQVNYAWADFHKNQRDYFDKKGERKLRDLDNSYRTTLIKQQKSEAIKLKEEIINHLLEMKKGVVDTNFNKWVDSQIEITNHREKYYNFLKNNPNYRG